MPSPGWRPENRWLGALPYTANPRFLDPENGIVANTGNQIVERPFPLHVAHDWGDTQRIDRLNHLVGARSVHTRDSLIEAQLDTVSPTARRLLPLVAANLWFSGDAAAEGTPRPYPAARAAPAGRLEWRDERTSARTADLYRLDARASGTTDPRRTWPLGRTVHPY